MVLPTPGGGRYPPATARSLADATAETAALAIANGSMDPDDSGLTGGAVPHADDDGDDAHGASSLPELDALLNGDGAGPSSPPGRQTRNRSYPGSRSLAP
jgi:hypothetical protein